MKLSSYPSHEMRLSDIIKIKTMLFKPPLPFEKKDQFERKGRPKEVLFLPAKDISHIKEKKKFSTVSERQTGERLKGV